MSVNNTKTGGAQHLQFFHLSQSTLPRDTPHPTHHRPLLLLMVLCMFCQQLGMFDTFAASVSEATMKYIYVQNNSTIDDSWIGTPISKKTSTPSQKSLKPISSVADIQNIPQNTDTLLISDGSWIFPGKVKKPVINTPTDATFNSAPNQELSYSNNANITTNGILPLPANYVTPNGTSYYAIPGNTGPQSSSTSGDANIGGNTNVGGSVSVGGNLSVSGTTTLKSTNTPAVNVLGQDTNGTVTQVTLGSGINLSGGVLSVDAGGLTQNISASGITAENIIVQTGSISSLSSQTGTITNLFSDMITAVKGVFDEIVTNILRARTAVIENIFSKNISTENLTATGVANFNMANFSGNVTFNNLPSFPLSEGALMVGDTGNKASELTAGSGGQVLVILNGTPVWTDATTVAPVISLFGRTGAVIAKTGDYNTSQVTESGSLYFTVARVLSSTLTGFSTSAGLVTATDTVLSALGKLQGTNTLQDTNIATATGNIATLSGNLATTSTNLTTLSGVVANKVGLSAFSAVGPLTYNSTIGVFGITQSSSTASGFLSAIDWNTFNSKQNAMVQASTTASGWLSSTDWNTFNNKIGLSSLSATGGISYNSGTGLFSDLFTFSNGLTRIGNSISISSVTGAQLSGFTAGQLTFGSASGGLIQSNNLFWDNTNGRLGVGTNAPSTKFQVTAGASNVDGLYMRANADWDAIGFAHDGSIGYINAAGAESGISFRVATGATGNAQTQTYFERMRILANGNVGIGTSSPNSKLQVSSSDYMLHLGEGSGGAGIDFKNRLSAIPTSGTLATIAWMESTSGLPAGTLLLASRPGIGGIALSATGTTPNLYIAPSTGNVGIGTITPNSKLEINSGTGGISGMRFSQLNSSTPTTSSGSKFLSLNANGDIIFSDISNSSPFNIFGTNTDAGNNKTSRIWRNGGMLVGEGVSSGSTFNGYYGAIGDFGTNPNLFSFSDSRFSGAGFNVSNGGGANFLPVFIATPSGAQRFIFGTTVQSDTGGEAALQLRITNTSLGPITNRPLFTVQNGGIGGFEAFRITANGRVGIGTTTPSSKLEINSGTGGLSGLRFTQLLSSTAGNGQFSGILGVNSTGDVGIAQLTGNSLTGFTNGQLTFGNASGGLSSTGGLSWNSATNRFSVNGFVNMNNAVSTTHPLTIRANGVDVLAFQDNTGTTKWHWNLLGSGLNFVESGVADYRLFLENGGNVGIGTNAPSYKLHVNGTAAGTSWTNTSDERFKTNISNISSGLDVINALRSVSYNWNALGKEHGGDIDKRQYGFIAQEVESLLPEIVNTDSEGYKSIDYIKIIPFLTKALQELTQNTASTGALSTLSGQVASLAGDMVSLSGQVAILSQNTGGTVVNNYYSSNTTVSGTGITNTGELMGLTDMVATLSGSIANQSTTIEQLQAQVDIMSRSIFSGSSYNPMITGSNDLTPLVWTHSGAILTDLETSTGEPRNVLSYITHLFSRAIDVVRDFVALEITALRGYFDQIWAEQVTTDELTATDADVETLHTDRICMKRSNGSEICINGDQLADMVNTPIAPVTSTPIAPVTPTESITNSGNSTEDTIIEPITNSEPIIVDSAVTDTTTITPETPVVDTESTDTEIITP